MDGSGGKIEHPFTGNEQADPKKQKTGTSKGRSREERLDLFVATYKDQSIFELDKNNDEDLSGPHEMTMREMASMHLDELEHGNFDLELDYSNIADGGVLRFYDPQANIIPVDQEMISEIMDCSKLAIQDYNKSNGTHFEVINVIKANIEVVAPYIYYITFEAADNTQSITESFQATVALCFPLPEKVVQLVRIRQPPQPYSPSNSTSSN